MSGFGAELAVLAWGGQEVAGEIFEDYGGVRGLSGDWGAPDDLFWMRGTLNYGEGVRSKGDALTPQPGEGLEVWIPWLDIWPTLAGGVPPGAEISVTAVLASDAGYLSNQMLPPLAKGSENPGYTPTALPGVVSLTVDSDADGVGDGGAKPLVRP